MRCNTLQFALHTKCCTQKLVIKYLENIGNTRHYKGVVKHDVVIRSPLVNPCQIYGGDRVAIVRLSYTDDTQLQKVLAALGDVVISYKVSNNNKGEFKKAYIKLNI